MADRLAEKDNTLRSMKLELNQVRKSFDNVNEELALVKGINFVINQRIVRIVEQKDVLSQMFDAKLAPILSYF